MPEETAQGTGTDTGQAEGGTEGTQTAGQAPAGGEGQPGGDQGTTGGQPAAGTQTEDTFFDPASIQGKPELEAAYKSMQRAFTKGMEGIKASKSKIAAYDAFNSDPVGQMQQFAARMGYKLTRADAAQALENQNQGTQQQAADWEPKDWNDVLTRATSMAKQELMRELQPVLNEVKGMKQGSIERQLSEIDPTWQQYESAMMENLQKHKTLANDPAMLYRMSVPPEVLESRATQKALEKLQKKTDGTQAGGVSTTKGKNKSELPDKPLSFSEAVTAAKAKLAAEGITGP